MKRVRSINGDTRGKQSKPAAGGGGDKKSKTTMMAAKAAAAPDQNCRPDHNPVHHPDAEAADVPSIISNAAPVNGLVAAEAAAAVMEKREEEEAAVGREWYYDYNCGGVVDYEQMWWGSIWLPNWDVENYLADDFVAGDNAAAVGWDIDDIWNFKGGSTNYY